MSNWYSWYRPLDKKIELELREKLIEIAMPSAEDWRNLTIVSANAERLSKVAPKSKGQED